MNALDLAGRTESRSAAGLPVVTQRPRLEFIDNLRWVTIVLVVSMHSAVTYSHVGSWYFMEDPKPAPLMTALFATYQAFLQAFFMGLLFFVAGYFVPDAYDRKGFGRFLRDRAVRLGIPSLFFMLVVQPITVYWLLRDFAHQSRPSLLQAYWPYVKNGRFLGGSGPMWFAVALLLFSCVYAIGQALKPADAHAKAEEPLPGNRQVLGLALLMGLCTFLARIIQPIGTNVLNMQLCFFSQYIFLFALGIRAKRANWLLRIPYSFGIRWLKVTLLAGSLAWIAIVFAVVKTHGEQQVAGGLTWQSAMLSFWESFFCVGICLGLLVLSRDKFNHQSAFTKWLSDNSFAVYLFHTPLLIAVTLGLRDFAAPKPVKFLCATILGATVTYVASSFVFRRIPVLKRVL